MKPCKYYTTTTGFIPVLALSILIASVSASQIFASNTPASQEYKADWDDLNSYPQAVWLNELKFGLYWHWNLNTIAGYDGWYGRKMYAAPNDATYQHHLKTHGHPAKFGYKDFEPLFTAEKFSARQWVEDSERIGAKFIVGMAVHHDGYDMYDSSHTPWNSVDKNPHIDVIGELAKEARAKGMKFGATSHLAWNWKYFSSYMYPDKFDGKDAPELYNIHDPEKGPSPGFAQEWYCRTIELIDNYELDFLWFDFGTRHPAYSDKLTAKLTAHFYNRSVEWGKTVALATKVGFNNRKSQVQDLEHGKYGYIRYPQWMADCTMNRGWFHLGGDEDEQLISGQYWLYQLIDMVSKNGTLLLNLGPKADGSWPMEWKNELFKMGDWLKLNGDAIYGTKPWHRYGEGPTHAGNSKHYNLGGNLTSNDIRFTRNGDALYAIVCGWRTKPIDIISLGKDELPGLNIKHISLNGCDEPIRWESAAQHLRIHFPEHPPCDFAYTFKIEGDGLFPERPSECIPVDIQPPTDSYIKALRISIPGKNRQLALAEIVATWTDHTRPRYNVADRAKVSMSSSLTPASRAIDGNMNGHHAMRSVAVTQAQDNPWILLEWDEPMRILDLFVYAGIDHAREFIDHAIVEGLDADDNTVYSIKISNRIDCLVDNGLFCP